MNYRLLAIVAPLAFTVLLAWGKGVQDFWKLEDEVKDSKEIQSLILCEIRVIKHWITTRELKVCKI